MSYSSSFSNRLDDYKQLNAIPASVSMLFIYLSLVTFGGLPQLTLEWFNLTIPSSWLMPLSAGVIMLALFSSETDDISRYSDFEIFWIGGMLVFVFGWSILTPDRIAQHVPVIGQALHDLLMGVGSPLAGMIAFGVSMAGWAVLVN